MLKPGFEILSGHRVFRGNPFGKNPVQNNDHNLRTSQLHNPKTAT